MLLSVIVKAFNEGKKIEKCLNSIYKCLNGQDFEVILVDSLSTDDTVEKALNFPTRIVQLAREEDRSCGAAVQLGYEASSGDYILLIDGDMELCDGFIEDAFDFLEKNPKVAGVGGLIIDTDIVSLADLYRFEKFNKQKKIIYERALGGGGLYRRTAIESVNYFSHVILKASEEFELGIRLRSNGWELARLPISFSSHTGHKLTSGKILIKNIKNGRAGSTGLVIKLALFKPWFFQAIIGHWYITLSLALFLILLSSVFFGLPSLYIFSLLWLAIFATISIKKKNIRHSLFSIFSWNCSMLASLLEFIRTPIKSNQIPYKTLK